MTANSRVMAARALVQVLQQRKSLNDVLAQHAAEFTLQRERALMQELCYGVVRWKPRLEAVLECLLRTPFKERDQDIHCLLLVGLYQLAYLTLPAHAAVDATVTAVGVLGKGWAKGVVNAVLRNYLRDSTRLLAEADANEDSRLAHPAWLLAMLRQAWPESECSPSWQAIVAANNLRPPMCLRVNARRASRGQYLATLQAAGLAGYITPHSAQGVVLEQPMGVDSLPGFSAGEVSVQDAGAQLAAGWLGAEPGERVLDACSAPGGKTCHILELQPSLLELVALDNSVLRLARVRENLVRLGLEAQLVEGDAGAPGGWWDGKPFDRILLDAPCSGTGVIRRHPDIKWLRRPTDITAAAQTQRRLLQALWPLLKPGGVLLYAVCSVLPEEGEQQVRDFVAGQQGAHAEPLLLPGVAVPAGSRCGISLPTGSCGGMDGFYYARLRKH
ncbi:MAG: 16S rRNA (cytosine(967)-C(5))-methyltransferase RsmB [Gammaproteobacteria bacterium]|nr:16S rRNA (cytosine(967)-C(5))-methyltransferase RsmB [Gammaproteobacteria bacterium]